MSEKYEPQAGDRVRVVLEGETNDVRKDGGFVLGINYIIPAGSTVVSIEKIEPPAHQFGPGDTIRHKTVRNLIYTLGREGYLSHHHGSQWRPWSVYESDRGVFTDRQYEKVDLGS